MDKDKIARFGVSLSRSLLKELDRMVKQKGYRNRSLAIGDMVRDHLVGHRQEMTDIDNCLEVLVIRGRASVVRSVEKTRCRSEGNCVLQPGIPAASTDATKV